MRVLLISHTCQSRTEGQPKAVCLGRFPDIELRVLIPDRWMHYGKWREAQLPESGAFDYRIGKVAWPWVGQAQFYLHWYPKLAELLKEFQPDIIDLWEEPWGLVSYQVCRLRDRLVPKAKIVTETEQNINKRLPFPFEQFRTYTLERADFAIGRNTEAVAILREKGYSGPAEVVPNAVDAELFHPMDRETCRRELGLTGFVAGYVGRIVAEKGLMDLLEALSYCPDHVNLLIVGAGDYQGELEARAEASGNGKRVRFMSGRPLQELPQIMNAMDVLVLPSRTTARWKEQFGRVLIEANACRTPVIGTDSGAIPDVVGEAGLIVPERNPEALAQALRELDAHPERRTEMGRRVREQVVALYTWERVAAKMRSIYLKTLGVSC